MNASLAPLSGLVLAGGASRRMGHDKAAVQYHGKPQVEWVRELLARHCEHVFVSIRADQQDDPLRRAWPVIADVLEGLGPFAGIAAAQAHRPDHAWLVLACDLPFVTDECLRRLIAHRDGRPVVAFRSTHDGLPEPLCAIYEPASRAGIAAAIESGNHCPRRFVIRSGVPLLDQPDASALDNVNTPEEFLRARTSLAVAQRGAAS